jgi:hypothetical protein
MIKLSKLVHEQSKSKQKDFDRVKFYLEYYKNLSPKEFDVDIKSNVITIKINK